MVLQIGLYNCVAKKMGGYMGKGASGGLGHGEGCGGATAWLVVGRGCRVRQWEVGWGMSCAGFLLLEIYLGWAVLE